MIQGRGLLFLLLFMVLVTGCAQDKLFFSTYTKFGISASAVGGQPVDLSMGYNRFEGAVIPIEQDEQGGVPDEAPSVFATIDIDNRWFNGITAIQVFATGDAAITAADDVNGFSAIVEKLNKDDEQGQ